MRLSDSEIQSRNHRIVDLKIKIERDDIEKWLLLFDCRFAGDRLG